MEFRSADGESSRSSDGSASTAPYTSSNFGSVSTFIVRSMTNRVDKRGDESAGPMIFSDASKSGGGSCWISRTGINSSVARLGRVPQFVWSIHRPARFGAAYSAGPI